MGPRNRHRKTEGGKKGWTDGRSALSRLFHVKRGFFVSVAVYSLLTSLLYRNNLVPLGNSALEVLKQRNAVFVVGPSVLRLRWNVYFLSAISVELGPGLAY